MLQSTILKGINYRQLRYDQGALRILWDMNSSNVVEAKAQFINKGKDQI